MARNRFLAICLLLFAGLTTHAQTDSALIELDSNGIVLNIDSLATKSDSLLRDSLPQEVKPSGPTASDDLKFVSYLISSELYRDAETALDMLFDDERLTSEQRDSVLFYRGWIRYYRQDFNAAIDDFEQINNESEVYLTSAFHKAICHVYLDSLDRAEEILVNLDPKGKPEIEAFKRMELAGIALLKRDYHAYDSLASEFTGTHYQFSKEESNLDQYAMKMRSFKRKSPFVAGLLSALLPGLGKFYVGYKGLPFGAFTLTIPFMAIAIETAIIGGFTSVAFLIAAPIAAVFYIGNIWGSALSAYAFEREFYEDMDHNIVYDVHISMRRLFL